MTSNRDQLAPDHLPPRTRFDTLTDVVAAAASIAVSFVVMIGYRLPGSAWWSALAVFGLTCFQAWRTLALDTDLVLAKYRWRTVAFAIAGGLSTWAYASLVFPDGVSRLLASTYH